MGTPRPCDLPPRAGPTNTRRSGRGAPLVPHKSTQPALLLASLREGGLATSARSLYLQLTKPQHRTKPRQVQSPVTVAPVRLELAVEPLMVDADPHWPNVGPAKLYVGHDLDPRRLPAHEE